MVYERYIKKNGKTYGPYKYHSKKENGKVVSHYVGKSESSVKKKLSKKFIFTGIFILIAILFVIYLANLDLTGNVSLVINNTYEPGEQIEGNLKLNLKTGELLPANSIVLINNSGEVSEFILSDLIDEKILEGNFYAEGKTISGNGSGYGVIGEKKIYPEVYFDLLIKEADKEKKKDKKTDEEKSQEVEDEETAPLGVPQSTELGGKEIEEEESEQEESESDSGKKVKKSKKAKETDSEESSSEVKSEEVESSGDSESEEEVEESEPEPVEEVESTPEPTPKPSPITGEVISSSEETISGSVNKDNPFSYNLEGGQTAEIVSGSVKVDSEEIDESNLKMKVKKKEVVVSTNYFMIEQGFGEEYLSDEELEIKIDLFQLDLVAQDGEIVVSLIYESEKLASTSEKINVEQNLSETNVTIENITEANVTVTNITEINIIETNISVKNITTWQYKAVIGRPVKNIKIVDVTNLSVEIPKQAVNITIKTGEEIQEALRELERYEEIINQANRNEIVLGSITGMVSMDLELHDSFLIKLFNKIKSLSITGASV
ncbi:hypothetical protein ACFL0X_02755 [Nanoarchaeota archaeon]